MESSLFIGIIYLVVLIILTPGFLMMNKIWKWRLSLDAKELAVREQEIEQREKLLPLLDGVAKEHLRDVLAQHAPALLLEIETEAREKAEAMLTEVRASIQRAYDET